MGNGGRKERYTKNHCYLARALTASKKCNKSKEVFEHIVCFSRRDPFNPEFLYSQILTWNILVK